MVRFPRSAPRGLALSDEITRRRREVALSGFSDGDGAFDALADADPMTRATALGALERAERLGDDQLRAALVDEHADVRRRAAELAATHGDVDLLGALADDEPAVVEAAAWACGERDPDEAVVGRLAELATAHDDPLCREAAVAALGALGNEAGLDAVLTATTDKPAVRRRAVVALAAFAGPAVDAALQRALEDQDWQVRQAAEDLLG